MNPLTMFGSAGSIIAVLGLLTTLGAGAAAIIHEHDAKLVATVAAEQATAAATALHAEDQRTIAGLNAEGVLAVTRMASNAKLKEVINATAPTSTCATSPAATAFVGGMRSGPVGGNADPSHAIAAVRVAVPGPAGAAR